MKRQSILHSRTWIIASMTLLMLSGCSWGKLTYKTETLDKLNVKVDKPEQWKSTRIESGDSYVDYIIEIPEKNSNKQSIAGKMSINLVKPLPGEVVKLQEEVDGLKKLFATNITDLKTLEETDTQLMNLPAKRVLLQFRNNEDKTAIEKAIFTVTVKDNNAYVILFDDDVNDFQKYLPVYEKMALSMMPL